ncbi:MAG TPA: cysteine desulfurase family protein [Myxococcota bacterium]|nr:cysteine desulfurase family protein [Myxococcota bacterium]
MKPPLYLDHHATTPVDPRVLDAMLPYYREDFGNAASATHAFGWRAEAAVENARRSIAGAIGARDPREIVFTSGSTESDNLALKGVAFGLAAKGDHLVTTAIEHPAVLDPCRWLEAQGRSVTLLPVDGEGFVDPAAVAAAIGPRTILVSVMAANSEIGVLEPLAEIGRVCRERGVLFHSDAAQAVGKIPLDVEALGVDLLSFSAHKIYGPKGVGALYVRRARPRIRIEPLLHGGGHEHGLRSGTLPVPLIVGFAKALELCLAALPEEGARIARLRDDLLARLEGEIPGLRLTGPRGARLPGNLHVCIPGIDADQVIVALGDVALSTGSACASARGEPSHVLRALGLPESALRSGLRMGLGRGTTREEIDFVADRLAEVVRDLRERAPRAAVATGG